MSDIGIIAKWKGYSKAFKKWRDAGYPERTDEQVDEILLSHCSNCKYLVDHICNHPTCGCHVVNRYGEDATFVGRLVKRMFSAALLNKIRMATEHCPIGRW